MLTADYHTDHSMEDGFLVAVQQQARWPWWKTGYLRLVYSHEKCLYQDQSFFNRGVTYARFRLSGKIPVETDAFIRSVMIGSTIGNIELFFKSAVGMASREQVLLAHLLLTLSISFRVWTFKEPGSGTGSARSGEAVWSLELNLIRPCLFFWTLLWKKCTKSSKRVWSLVRDGKGVSASYIKRLLNTVNVSLLSAIVIFSDISGILLSWSCALQFFKYLSMYIQAWVLVFTGLALWIESLRF